MTRRIEIDGIDRDWILRTGFDDAGFGGMLDKTTEAHTVAAACDHGVRAPEVIYVLAPEDGLGQGFIMPALPGEGLPQRIFKQPALAPALEQLASACGQQLATIHAVPAAALPALPLRDAAASVDDYFEFYQGFGQILPAFELTFRVLRERMPEPVAPVLVHGDFRMGNLLIDHSGLQAVLDWELAHRGDAMEDLGWICGPAWRFGRLDKPVGGFGRREDLFAAYAAAGGRAVDRDRVWWWELFGILKWGVICLYQLQRHLDGSDPSLERLAIGRRVSECELDMMHMLADTGGVAA